MAVEVEVAQQLLVVVKAYVAMETARTLVMLSRHSAQRRTIWTHGLAVAYYWTWSAVWAPSRHS